MIADEILEKEIIPSPTLVQGDVVPELTPGFPMSIVPEIKLSMLPFLITFNYRYWLRIARKSKKGKKPYRDHPSPLKATKRLTINDQSFPLQANQLYRDFCKHIGYPKRWADDPFMSPDDRGVLAQWFRDYYRELKKGRVSGQQKNETPLQTATDYVDKKNNDKVLMDILPEYKFDRIKILYWQSLTKLRPDLSKSKLAEIAGVAGTTVGRYLGKLNTPTLPE